MDHLFDEMIETLLAARDAVHQDIKAQARRPIPDGSRLRQLSQWVRSLAHLTDSLLLLMVERNAPETLLDSVEDLFDVFNDAEDRIETRLAAGRGRIKARGRA